jgi:hypothetical protein
VTTVNEMRALNNGEAWGHPLKGTCQEKKVFLEKHGGRRGKCNFRDGPVVDH